MRRGGVLALAILASASVAPPATGGSPQAERLTVDTRPVRHFRIGSSEDRFGPLEFVGGLEMSSGGRDFGALSSFRFRSPGDRFIGVADTGFWFFGRIERGDDGTPIGLDDFVMTPMVDAEGRSTRDKWTTDAESIAVKDDLVTVGFERAHRITEFRVTGETPGLPMRHLDFIVPQHELRRNRGFETIAYAPEDGPLQGARVVVCEKSIDGAGNLFAAILEGPRRGLFTVVRHDGFDVADGVFLPDGDLLLLERRFSMATGIAMRLRRIDGASIREGAVVDGPVILEADMAFQIDNMEALDVWQRADGATMLSLMSDDNHSILQRNLYLEFRLHRDSPQ